MHTTTNRRTEMTPRQSAQMATIMRALDTCPEWQRAYWQEQLRKLQSQVKGN
jgi:hypothetical protein